MLHLDEKQFGFVKVGRVLYPNNTALIELRLIGSQDERECCAISANPHQAAAELRRIADWMDGTDAGALRVGT
jgi:hypothetical protein